MPFCLSPRIKEGESDASNPRKPMNFLKIILHGCLCVFSLARLLDLQSVCKEAFALPDVARRPGISVSQKSGQG